MEQKSNYTEEIPTLNLYEVKILISEFQKVFNSLDEDMEKREKPFIDTNIPVVFNDEAIFKPFAIGSTTSAYEFLEKNSPILEKNIDILNEESDEQLREQFKKDAQDLLISARIYMSGHTPLENLNKTDRYLYIEDIKKIDLEKMKSIVLSAINSGFRIKNFADILKQAVHNGILTDKQVYDFGVELQEQFKNAHKA